MGEIATFESRFVFLAGVLALDFINTEVIIRRKRHDLLSTTNELAAWQRAAVRHYPEMATEPYEESPPLLAAAHALRAGLRHVLELRVAGEALSTPDLSAINRILQAGYSQLEVAGEGVVVSRSMSHLPAAERMLLPIAYSAQWVLTVADTSRLHQCRNPHCILFFYDATRSATRAWCSMGCMNRARSAEEYRKRDQ